eukprot:12106113-Ditylum_brightwellii.AAC.1
MADCYVAMEKHVTQGLRNAKEYRVCNASIVQCSGISGTELQIGWGIARSHANAPKHSEVSKS